jgi:DNA-binding PadR family transcriptional regulator
VKQSGEVERTLPLTHLSFQILLALSDRDLHGYAIIKAVRENPTYPGNPGTGTFYSAISRMQEERLIAEVEPPEDSVCDSRRRFYSITDIGRDILQAETKRLEQLVVAAKATIASVPGQGQ